MKNKTRCVLNLNLEQAKELKAFLDAEDEKYTTATIEKLSLRLANTITKHETSGGQNE